jgi:anaerobic selenocysteine-containing dehydrogenase
MSFTVHRRCTICGTHCGIDVKVDGARVLRIEGDRLDEVSRGHICPKAMALKDVYEDPERLRRPVRRTADGWEELDWGEAIRFAAAGIRKVAAAHGPDAVASYWGNPAGHSSSMTSFLMLRLAIGTKSHYSVASVDQAPHHLVAAEMFGNPLALPIPDRLGVPFHGSRRQRVSGLPDLMFELPMAGLADEILTPGDEQVRAMVVFGGNPVLSAPGGRRLDAAFEQLDFCVALDFYITETSRHADVILPPVSSLQRNDFDAFVPMMSARNHTATARRRFRRTQADARIGRSSMRRRRALVVAPLGDWAPLSRVARTAYASILRTSRCRWRSC